MQRQFTIQPDERRFLNFMDEFMRFYGFIPPVKETARCLGFTIKDVKNLITRLKTKGAVSYEKDRKQTLKIRQ